MTLASATLDDLASVAKESRMMVWYRVARVVEFLLEVLAVGGKPADKDLEIRLLRQQLRVLERHIGKHPRPQPLGKVSAGGPIRPTEANDRTLASAACQALDFQTADAPELAPRVGATPVALQEPTSCGPTSHLG